MNIHETDFIGLKKSDEKAFERIFCQYYKTLVSFAMRYGLEQMEAEDVVIEVFHHVWEIREELKSAVGLHSLLYTATKNRALNIIRDLKNREKIIAQVVEEPEEERNFLMEEEMSRLLDEAIGELPPQCAQVMTGLLAGQSLAELANMMGISINTAKTYKLRAIQTLREQLKNAHPFLLLWLLVKIND